MYEISYHCRSVVLSFVYGCRRPLSVVIQIYLVRAKDVLPLAGGTF